MGKEQQLKSSTCSTLDDAINSLVIYFWTAVLNEITSIELLFSIILCNFFMPGFIKIDIAMVLNVKYLIAN